VPKLNPTFKMLVAYMFVKTSSIVCSSVNKAFLFWGVHRETVLQFIKTIDRLLHSNLVKLIKLNSIDKQ
jgi:hypothetical protein